MSPRPLVAVAPRVNRNGTVSLPSTWVCLAFACVCGDAVAGETLAALVLEQGASEPVPEVFPPPTGLVGSNEPDPPSGGRRSQ